MPLRIILRALNRLRVRLTGDRPGVHSVALTPGGAIVLVKLRYARGWRLPGGGRKQGEDPREAALRELAEEIGMTGHGAVEPVPGEGSPPSLFVVREVEYRPRWSLEIEAVTEAAPGQVPRDLAPSAARAISLARALL